MYGSLFRRKVWVFQVLYDNFFSKFYLSGEKLGNKTMIVAMHSTEGEKPIAVSNFIGSPDDPLYSLKLSNTFYNGTYTPKCDENDEATRIVVSFLKRYCF